jgi:hypothetical protein
VEPTRAVVISASKLIKVCEQDHELGFHFYRAIASVVASRLKATRLQLLDMFSVGERM